MYKYIHAHKMRKCEVVVAISALISMTLLYQPNIVYIFVFFFRLVNNRKTRGNWDLPVAGEFLQKYFIWRKNPKATNTTRCKGRKKEMCFTFYWRPGNSSRSSSNADSTDCRVNNIWQSMWNSTHTTHISVLYVLLLCVRCAFWLKNSSVDIPMYMQHTSKIYASPFNSIYYYILCDPKLSFSRFYWISER